MEREIKAENIWFGKNGDGVPRIKRFLEDSKVGLTPETLWRADVVGTSDEAKKQSLQLFPNEAVFDTPKPERLIARVLEIEIDRLRVTTTAVVQIYAAGQTGQARDANVRISIAIPVQYDDGGTAAIRTQAHTRSRHRPVTVVEENRRLIGRHNQVRLIITIEISKRNAARG